MFVVGDVAEVGDGPAARRADLGGDLLGGGRGGLARAVAARLPVVVDHDGCAEAGEFQGFGAAQAAPGTGDDRGQALQWLCHSCPLQSSGSTSDLYAGAQRGAGAHLVERVIDLGELDAMGDQAFEIDPATRHRAMARS